MREKEIFYKRLEERLVELEEQLENSETEKF